MFTLHECDQTPCLRFDAEEVFWPEGVEFMLGGNQFSSQPWTNWWFVLFNKPPSLLRFSFSTLGGILLQ